MGRGARNGFRQIKMLGLFGLAKIPGPEKLRQRNDLRAFRSRDLDPGHGFFKVLTWIFSAGHLDQCDPNYFFRTF